LQTITPTHQKKPQILNLSPFWQTWNHCNIEEHSPASTTGEKLLKFLGRLAASQSQHLWSNAESGSRSCRSGS